VLTGSSTSFGMNSRAFRMGDGDSGRIVLLDYKQVEVKVVGQTIAQLNSSWPNDYAARHFQQQNIAFGDGHVDSKSPDKIDPRFCPNYVNYWRPKRDSTIDLLGCLALGATPTNNPPGGTTGASSTTGGGTGISSGGTTSGGTTAGGTTGMTGGAASSGTTGATTGGPTGTTGGTTTGGTTTGGTTTGGSTTGGTPCTIGTAQLINDSAASYVGAWTPYSGAGYSSDLHYMGAGSGSNTATYQFTGLYPGQYQVAATWLASANRCAATPHIITGGASPTTVNVNQQVAPAADWLVSGTNFQNLAAVIITGTTLTVQITDNGSGLHIADAVRITCVGTNTPPGTYCDGLKGEYRGDSQSFTGFPSDNYFIRVDPSFNYPAGSACLVNCAANGIPSGVQPSPSGLPYPFPNNRNNNCADGDGDGVADCLFTVKWTGEIMAPTTDTYTFTGSSDDNVSIWINGSPVVVQSGNGPQGISGSVPMTANTWVPITIQFTNTQWANDFFLFQWSAPTMSQRFLAAPNIRTLCP